MPELVTLLVKDLPEQIMDEGMRQVMDYSVGLIAVNEKARHEEGVFIGSGTLVTIADRFCVLTAGHVVRSRHLRQCDSLGLSLMSSVHSVRIDRRYLYLMSTGTSTTTEMGPDLGLIQLPESHLGWVKAKKSFWDIETHAQMVLERPYGNTGAWAICGCAHEQTSFKTRERQYGKIFIFRHTLWFSGLVREWVSDGYDYIEISAKYEANSCLPKSFGGLSGGGVWQIPLFKEEDGRFVSEEPLLSGVAFYQGEIKDDLRLIRCHGRRSLYKKLREITNRDTDLPTEEVISP